MANLLLVILDDISRLPDLLAAWKRIGVPGVTLVESLGGYRLESWLGRLGLGGLKRLFDLGDTHQRMLFCVIEEEPLLELAISEADEIVGGFDRPHSGILFVVPVRQTLGLRKWLPAPLEANAEGSPPWAASSEEFDLLPIDRTTPVTKIIEVLSLEPVVVTADTLIPEIVNEVLLTPKVHLVCVVNQEKRLVGLIELQTLANALFFNVFPREFLSGQSSLEEVLEFADQTHMRIAADVMQEPAWVHLEDTLERAFHLMHEHKIPGLPVVDEHYHVIGYINLLELMAICLRTSTGTEGLT